MPIFFKISVKKIFFTLLLTASLLLIFFLPESFSPNEKKAAALTFVTIGLWATGSIPEHITALLFFLLAMLFSISPPAVIFSGFSSTAIWLIFSGLVIGVAITSTGLGKRIGGRIARYLEGGYFKIISGLVLVGILFSFLMPSAMGRVVLLVPIATIIADHLGFHKGTNGRTGVILATILGSYMPAFAILPANVPNMVLMGMSETQYHVSPLYGSYFFLHFPVIGAVKALLIVGLIVVFYPDKSKSHHDYTGRENKRLSRNESILAASLLAMLVLWMSDFIHHISPAWIALAGALFLLFPGIAIVNKQQFNKEVNWASLLFVAGILGLGGMINYTGLDQVLAQKILSLLPLTDHNTFVNYMSVTLASTLTGVVTTLPGVPAVFTPLTDSITLATGLSVKSVIMMQVLGFSTVVFPYQAPPIVVGMQLSGENFFSAIKICLILAVLTLIFLLPLNYIWWKILGWL